MHQKKEEEYQTRVTHFSRPYRAKQAKRGATSAIRAHDHAPDGSRWRGWHTTTDNQHTGGRGSVRGGRSGARLAPLVPGGARSLALAGAPLSALGLGRRSRIVQLDLAKSIASKCEWP